MTRLGRTALMSLSAAITLGVVGVPGALAESNKTSSSSSAASSMGLTYVVVNNDSLSRIASRVNVPINDLLAVNGFVRSSVIVPGQIIKLPDSATITPVSSSVSMSVASSGGPKYVVQRNDSLSLIASKSKVSLSALLAANKFTRSSVIIPGQIIKLPGSATITPVSVPVSSPAPSSVSMSAASSAGPRYVVQRNDSLSLIASKSKVSLSALLAANKFTRSSVIIPGQIIKLPAGATTATSISGAFTPTAPVAGANPSTSSKVQQVIEFARAQVGKPYVFATAGPATYDCSGLTKASYATVGIKLPHQSLAQSKLGVAIDWKTTPIQAGDLIFTFSSVNKTQISHVGIAISSTQWIEAPNTGSVVRISALPSAARIQAVRRFI
ncbi:MAG: LysM peptidoglycan-binding domain-containing protein [Ilumatobacteraceae bacterium]